jgi:hypothetical protein
MERIVRPGERLLKKEARLSFPSPKTKRQMNMRLPFLFGKKSVFYAD